MEQMTT